MKRVIPTQTKLTPLLLATVATLFSGSAFAAFFQLTENSPAGLGNALAGGSAIAEDASTVWFNPAGLTRLTGSQYVVGGNLIFPSLDFDNAGSTIVLGTPLTGGDGGDAGTNAIVPNFYYSRQLNERFTFGLSVNSPFGLVTDYDSDWVGRYYADRSKITTININPAIGYKISDRFSIGGGINVEYIDTELTQAIDFGTICVAQLGAAACGGLGLSPQGNDGKAKVTADDTGLGFNLGFLWQMNKDTRVGLAYRSPITHRLEGDNDVTTPAAAAPIAAGAGLVDGNARAKIILPATISVSTYHQFNSKWAIMGDVTQTRWGRLPELRIKFDTGAADSVVTLDLDDVYRYSVGATYTPNRRWTYRWGVAFDETPTPNSRVRTPRLPDEDRTWLSFGAHYKKSNKLSLDFAVAFLKFDDAKINKTTGTPENVFRGNLVGKYDTKATILSAQASWKF